MLGFMLVIPASPPVGDGLPAPQAWRRSEDLERTMKYAIVESGGKQYKAVEGGFIDVDRLPANPGDSIELDSVLLVADGEEIAIGTPTVEGAKVKATVVEHVKGPKLIVFKYRPKKRYRVKTGHRQQYTRLQILEIGTGK